MALIWQLTLDPTWKSTKNRRGCLTSRVKAKSKNQFSGLVSSTFQYIPYSRFRRDYFRNLFKWCLMVHCMGMELSFSGNNQVSFDCTVLLFWSVSSLVVKLKGQTWYVFTGASNPNVDGVSKGTHGHDDVFVFVQNKFRREGIRGINKGAIGEWGDRIWGYDWGAVIWGWGVGVI